MNNESTEVDKAEDRSKTLKVDGKTVPDILREMREFAEKRLAEQNYMMKHECVGLIVNQFAEMFEIVWKREREHLGKTDMLGNMAKMREALVSITKVPVPPILVHVRSPEPGIIMHEPEPENEWLAMLRKSMKLANAALAEPPRNCDVYRTADQAWKAYREWEYSLDYRHGAIGMDFRTWTFSQHVPPTRGGAE